MTLSVTNRQPTHLQPNQRPSAVPRYLGIKALPGRPATFLTGSATPNALLTHGLVAPRMQRQFSAQADASIGETLQTVAKFAAGGGAGLMLEALLGKLLGEDLPPVGLPVAGAIWAVSGPASAALVLGRIYLGAIEGLLAGAILAGLPERAQEMAGGNKWTDYGDYPPFAVGCGIAIGQTVGALQTDNNLLHLTGTMGAGAGFVAAGGVAGALLACLANKDSSRFDRSRAAYTGCCLGSFAATLAAVGLGVGLAVKSRF